MRPQAYWGSWLMAFAGGVALASIFARGHPLGTWVLVVVVATVVFMGLFVVAARLGVRRRKK